MEPPARLPICRREHRSRAVVCGRKRLLTAVSRRRLVSRRLMEQNTPEWKQELDHRASSIHVEYLGSAHTSNEPGVDRILRPCYRETRTRSKVPAKSGTRSSPRLQTAITAPSYTHSQRARAEKLFLKTECFVAPIQECRSTTHLGAYVDLPNSLKDLQTKSRQANRSWGSLVANTQSIASPVVMSHSDGNRTVS